MLFFQAVLISLLCYLGALGTPWLMGLTGGWYTISRPLVSGFLIGLILGDVTQGIIIGVAIQAVYIAMVTPGGQMPADLNFVAYPAIALAILSNSSTEVAVTLATTIGVIGTIVFNFFQVANSFWNHRAQKAIEEGNEKGFHFNAIVGPQLLSFALRFIPSFLVIYFGSSFAKELLESMPQYLIDVMGILGGALPAIGIVMLLTAVVKEDIMLLFFVFGFICVIFLKLNMFALAVVAGVIAYIYFQAKSKPVVKVATEDGTYDDFDDEEEF